MFSIAPMLTNPESLLLSSPPNAPPIPFPADSAWPRAVFNCCTKGEIFAPSVAMSDGPAISLLLVDCWPSLPYRQRTDQTQLRARSRCPVLLQFPNDMPSAFSPGRLDNPTLQIHSDRIPA